MQAKSQSKGKLIKVPVEPKGEAEEQITEQVRFPVQVKTSSGIHIVTEEESDLVHVELEKTAFSSATGKKLSIPFVQMFNKKEWGQVKDKLPTLGYTSINVLWGNN